MKTKKTKQKSWYEEIDAATLQRIKAYSAFNDAESKNLMVQTIYEYREKEIAEFKETNHELAELAIARNKRITDLEQKNKDLADCNSRLLSQAAAATKRVVALEKEITELKEELKNWKDEWQEQVQKAIDESYARTQQTIQLTKAKEIITSLLNVFVYDLADDEMDVGHIDVRTKAEQFLEETK